MDSLYELYGTNVTWSELIDTYGKKLICQPLDWSFLWNASLPYSPGSNTTFSYWYIKSWTTCADITALRDTLNILFSITLFLCIVGTLGNIMIMLVLFRRKKKTPTDIYLGCLAVCDIMILIGALPNVMVSLFGVIPFAYYIPCMVFETISQNGLTCCMSIMTCFTVERFIAIRYPIKAQAICSVSHAVRISVAVFIICSIYSPIVTVVSTRRVMAGGIWTCGAPPAGPLMVFSMVQFVIFYCVPLVLFTAVYGMMGRILLKAQKMASEGAGGLRKTQGHNSASKMQIVKMLAVVVVSFYLLFSPYRLLPIINMIRGTTTDPDHRTTVSDVLRNYIPALVYYLNSTINPVVYNVMSLNFRRDFLRMIGLRRSGAGRGGQAHSTAATCVDTEYVPLRHVTHQRGHVTSGSTGNAAHSSQT